MLNAPIEGVVGKGIVGEAERRVAESFLYQYSTSLALVRKALIVALMY